MREFAYDRQVTSMPEVVAAVLRQPPPPTLDPDRPILFTGIGTSLHAARVAASWIMRLSGGRVRAHAVDAHDLGTGAAPLTAGDQVVVISHRGNKLFPTASLVRAREMGAAQTIAIVGDGAPEQEADHVIRVCPNEASGTFSVSYLASLAMLARMVAPFETGDAFACSFAALPEAIARTLAMTAPAPPLVAALAEARLLLIVGFADDLPTAQEAALKLKEGAWMWSEAMSPEFALHGTPAGFQPGMATLLIAPAWDDGGRTATLRDVLDRLALGPVLTCGESDGMGAELRFAPSPHPLLRPMLAILPFHRLTAELARVRGSDPDTLHGGRTPWREIMTELRL